MNKNTTILVNKKTRKDLHTLKHYYNYNSINALIEKQLIKKNENKILRER